MHFALIVAMIATVPTLEAATYFTVTSTSMKDGAPMPARFAADNPKRPCKPGSTEICRCPGQIVSPQLAWSNAPAGSKSFAVLMFDVDGQSGAGVSRWVAYNTAPAVHELAEGDGSANSVKIEELHLEIGSGPEQRAVQAFALDGADQPFNIGMRRRRVRNGLDFFHIEDPQIPFHWWNRYSGSWSVLT